MFAIKTIASLLYSMETEIEWEAFKDKDLAIIEQNEKNILMTLKLSYDRLPSELKQCFAYCSLFPKDHMKLKQDLICLWMAQGFLRSSSGKRSPEDVGHEYFMQLMRRCFFQDAYLDEVGEIISCKMHDIMHDLAQLVTEGEILLVDRATQKINDDILHVNFPTSSVETPSRLLDVKQLRSFLGLYENMKCPNLGKVLSSLKCLRALHLTDCDSLPDSLGSLKHLRYLKVDGDLENLPECITRLQNLQTLDVWCCFRLRELPGGFSKLINLRHLHLHEQIDEMAPGIGQLTSLRALSVFVVGKHNGLNELVTLNHLVGPLTIRLRKHRRIALSDTTDGLLKDTKLTGLELLWNEKREYDEEGDSDNDSVSDESEMRCLRPPPSLRSLKVCHWKGVRFPSWGMDEIPNLVKIEIKECRRCQHLPPLSQLPHLKTLKLWELDALEYIESNSGNNSEASSSSAAACKYYIPSLESLELWNLPELKGWSRSKEEDTTSHKEEYYAPLLSRLSYLNIRKCPKLTLMPLAPRLETLDAKEVHGKLIKHLLLHGEQISESESTTSHLSHSSYLSSLWDLRIRRAHELESLSINNLCSLELLRIKSCRDLINVILSSPIPMSSFRKLVIDDISSLRQHVNFLEKLTIKKCPELDLRDLIDDNDGVSHTLQSLRSLNISDLRGLPESIVHLTQLCKLRIEDCIEWTALSNLVSLQQLKIINYPTLIELPESFGSLMSLQKLEIGECPSLTALPKSFRNLTSLQSLEICNCLELGRNCEKPDGQDWPLIQHIPNIHFYLT